MTHMITILKTHEINILPFMEFNALNILELKDCTSIFNVCSFKMNKYSCDLKNEMLPIPHAKYVCIIISQFSLFKFMYLHILECQ